MEVSDFINHLFVDEIQTIEINSQNVTRVTKLRQIDKGNLTVPKVYICNNDNLYEVIHIKKKIDMNSPEFRKMVDELLEEIKGIPEDPETLEAAEKLHRELSYLSPEDLHKPFTI